MRFPTPTHMAISYMYNNGKVQYVVSQNCDGFHVKSGIKRTDMSELHGNTNVEICKKCNIEYYRPFRCRTATRSHEHLTDRKCDKCQGFLEDTIVNFGESLPHETLERAYENAHKSDLAIVMGTSMRVSPACELPPKCIKNGGAMVIVNLQKTPYDSQSGIRIFAKTDRVIEMLMEKLGYKIPPYMMNLDLTLVAVVNKMGERVAFFSL